MTTPTAASRAELFADARRVRADFLALWPEGVDPATLPEEQQQKLADAHKAVLAADKRLIDAGIVSSFAAPQ